jgi:hypothetical protein
VSVTIHYFFNYPKSLLETAEDINGWIGCNLRPYEGDEKDLFSMLLGMEFSLRSAEGFDNDKGMDFESFSYYLGFRTPVPNADARPIQLPAILTVIYALHNCLGITGTLVFDLQILLARYGEKDVPGLGRRLFDLLSSTPFISFQSHLGILSKRLPDNWQEFYRGPILV